MCGEDGGFGACDITECVIACPGVLFLGLHGLSITTAAVSKSVCVVTTGTVAQDFLQRFADYAGVWDLGTLVGLPLNGST